MHKVSPQFEFFLLQLETKMAKAAKQRNPALYLYKNDARTPLFMLEGLSKLYAELHNKKKFTKLKEHFKLLEDAIGAIDYYDHFNKNLTLNKKVPVQVTQYLQAQTREKIQHLNDLLEQNKWINDTNERIEKIRKKLTEATWMKPANEIKAIELFYGKAISNIIAFTESTEYHFDNMEDDVHELRRKIRWLSIYPQALQGCVQLTAVKPIPKHLKKYLTAEIVNSPYNIMPEIGNSTHILKLNKNYYLSLSWMIATLGKQKDNGLQIVAIKEALMQSLNMEEADALKQVYKILGTKQIKLQELLDDSEAICKVFFEEHNLEHLVAGASEIKNQEEKEMVAE